ncbi:MAG: helix-hairpin-helix domain-containing protein [Bryobacteraceae bacterium]
MAATLHAQKIRSGHGTDERRLRDLAGVGAAIEHDLHMLNVQTVSELAACDGDDLYSHLCEITGTRQDPCVLDTLRCAVAQARDARLPREQRNWWWWSRQRKQGRLP